MRRPGVRPRYAAVVPEGGELPHERLGNSLDSHSKHLAARAPLIRRCPQVNGRLGVRRDAGMQLS
eukprot:2569649-Prymnesium_polylepis.1